MGAQGFSRSPSSRAGCARCLVPAQRLCCSSPPLVQPAYAPKPETRHHPRGLGTLADAGMADGAAS
jgi:hypothetical protein